MEKFGIILIIISLFIFLYSFLKLHQIRIEKSKLTEEKEHFKNKKNEELEASLRERKEQIQREITERQEEADQIIKREEKRVADSLLLIEQKMAQEEKHLLEKRRLEQDLLFKDEFNIKRQEYEQKFSAYLMTVEEEKNNVEETLNLIKRELSECQSKRAAINEQIRKEEEIKEGLNLHRINLSYEDKEDIKFLLSIEHKINNKEVLYKLIWSEYLQKPFNQMIKSLFGANIPKNVIYCLERIEDSKKYIGKTSPEVSKRWTEHVKSSLSIGSIKKTEIHNALFNNWDGFVFYILEETTKEKLSEREKFYIGFYETNKYGFNLTRGG